MVTYCVLYSSKNHKKYLKKGVMMMRAKKLRILVLVLIATMLFGLVACGNNTTPANGDPITTS